MQIIIAQDEIELAIRRYIAEQINVRDGMEIDIDLKATRGEAGMQAFIDIRASNTAKAEVKAETNLNLVKTINTAKEEPKAVEAKASNDKAEPAPAEAEAEAAEDAPAEANRQSLFGGLKRPVNA